MQLMTVNFCQDRLLYLLPNNTFLGKLMPKNGKYYQFIGAKILEDQLPSKGLEVTLLKITFL